MLSGGYKLVKKCSKFQVTHRVQRVEQSPAVVCRLGGSGTCDLSVHSFRLHIRSLGCLIVHLFPNLGVGVAAHVKVVFASRSDVVATLIAQLL